MRAQRGADTTLGTSETTLGSGATPALNSPLLRDIRSLRSGNPSVHGSTVAGRGAGPWTRHARDSAARRGGAGRSCRLCLAKGRRRAGGEHRRASRPKPRGGREAAVGARVLGASPNAPPTRCCLRSATRPSSTGRDRPFAGSHPEHQPQNPRHRERIIAAVMREIAVARPLWEARPLLDADCYPSPSPLSCEPDPGEPRAHLHPAFADLPNPLLFAHRSLQRGDSHTAATALEAPWSRAACCRPARTVAPPGRREPLRSESEPVQTLARALTVSLDASNRLRASGFGLRASGFGLRKG